MLPVQMSAVIDMNAWKATHVPVRGAQQQRATAEPPPYCCMSCGSEVFRILEGGLVRCGRCTAHIRNLTIRS
jgi:hypothetical protein